MQISRALILGFPTRYRRLTVGLRTFGGRITLLPSIETIAISNTIPKARMASFLSVIHRDSIAGRAHLLRVLGYSRFFLRTCSLGFISNHNFSRSCKKSICGVILGRSTIHALKFRSSSTTLKRHLSIRAISRPVRVVKIIGSCRRRSLGGSFAPVLFTLRRGLD